MEILLAIVGLLLGVISALASYRRQPGNQRSPLAILGGAISGRPPAWTTLKTIGSLEVMRGSYLAIVVIPFAAVNNDFTDFIGYQSGYKLLFAYFAAVFLALGKSLYDVFCPRDIKQWRDEIEFQRHIREHEKLIGVSSELNDEARPQVVVIKGGIAPPADMPSSQEAPKRWHELNGEQRVATRVAIVISLAIGFIMSVGLIINRSVAVVKVVVFDSGAQEVVPICGDAGDVITINSPATTSIPKPKSGTSNSPTGEEALPDLSQPLIGSSERVQPAGLGSEGGLPRT